MKKPHAFFIAAGVRPTFCLLFLSFFLLSTGCLEEGDSDRNSGQNNGRQGDEHDTIYDNNRPRDEYNNVIENNSASNACGGTGELFYEGQPASPGSLCGPCEDGILTCQDDGTLACEEFSELNACGGCGILDAQPGESCGINVEWQCQQDGSIECLEIENPEVEFTTPIFDDVESEWDVTDDSATFTADVSSMPTRTGIVAQGFCWGTQPDPTVEAAATNPNIECGNATPMALTTRQGALNGQMQFNASGLKPGHQYYVRSFVTTELRTYYGDEITFVTAPKVLSQIKATKGEFSDFVRLEWDAINGASSYRIFRDDTLIATIGGQNSSYDDGDATAGSAPFPPSAITASSDFDNRISVQWDEPTVENGPNHTYFIRVEYPESISDASPSATGYRAAAPITNYEILIDGEWLSVGNDLSFEDNTPALNTIQNFSVTASQGTSTEVVSLSAPEPEINVATTEYRVRAINADGIGEQSAPAVGQIQHGALNYQWQRSAGATNTNFSALANATSRTVQDNTAPSDGSTRHYRLVVSGEGLETYTTSSTSGFRAALPVFSGTTTMNVSGDSIAVQANLDQAGVPTATQHGFCYASTPSPSATNGANCTSLGNVSGTGLFQQNISGFTTGGTYYIRPYAENPAGRVYGSETSFDIAPDAPTLQISSSAGSVNLNWSAVQGAAKYAIYRDNNLIDEVSGQTTYSDNGATAGGAPSAPTISYITQGDDPYVVTIYWNEANVSPGPIHSYRVVPMTANDVEGIPATGQGRRLARSVLGYEIRIDGGSWQEVDLSEALYFMDEDAPGTSVSIIDVAASQGTSGTFVDLTSTISDVYLPPTPRTYDVRAYNAAGSGAISSDEGYRGFSYPEEPGQGQGQQPGQWQEPLPQPLYQWYVKEPFVGTGPGASDPPEDGDEYANFVPVDNGDSYDARDFNAPSNGTEVQYYLEVYGPGFETTRSTIVTGFVGVEPTITGMQVDSVGETEATLYATIDDFGKPDITELGFCYSTSSLPSVGSNAECESVTIPTSPGPFQLPISNLDPGTQYYVRAYAINDAFTHYSSEESFTTDMGGPSGLMASSLENGVYLSWDSVPGADKYRIYRQGELEQSPTMIAEIDASETDYSDEVDGPVPEEVTITDVISGTGFIRLEWDEPALQQGSLYDYTVTAVDAQEIESSASLAASAAPDGSSIVDYEIEIDMDSNWVSIGNQLYYEDTLAEAGTIEAGTLTVGLGLDTNAVSLSAEIPTLHDGTTVSYRVRALNLDAQGVAQNGNPSNVETGARTVDENTLSYQWQRTNDDNPASTYFDLPLQCATSLDCDDHNAVAGQSYYYRLQISATGAESIDSDPQEGALAVLDMAFVDPFPTTIQAGDNFDVFVQLVNQYDDPIALNEIPIIITLNNASFGTEGDSFLSVDTDTNGLASFENLTILNSHYSYELTASSPYSELSSVYTQSEEFFVTPAAASADYSSISGSDNVLANGIATSNISIFLYDEYNNYIEGVIPAFSATGTGNSYDSCSITDSNGVSFCTMTSTEAGPKTLSITSPLTLEGDTINFVYDCPMDDSFSEGDGSEGDPYRICNPDHITRISNDDTLWDDSFRLMANIDLNNLPFTPIGNNSTPYSGTFDGNGFEISNLSYSASIGEDIGFFGQTNGAEIKDLGLVDIDIHLDNTSGNSFIGGLAGYMYDTLIEGVYVTGSLHGYSFVGGLAGEIDTTTIISSYTDVDLTASYYAGGGLAGAAYDTLAQDSYALGIVRSSERVGGLFGDFLFSTVEDSYSAANVEGDWIAGGLIGHGGTGIDIINSYATGDVSGNFSVGGLGGYIAEADISDSYAKGSITGGEATGGLLGYFFDSILNDSFATGDVIGANKTGGLIGWGFGDGSTPLPIANTYATGNVGGTIAVGGLIGLAADVALSTSYAIGNIYAMDNAGGLVGEHESATVLNVTDSYFNANAICQNCSVLPIGTSLSYADMTAQDDQIFAGFDFNADWQWADCGTPHLIWEDTTEISCDNICDPYVADFTSGPGDGSSVEPYEICSALQLQHLASTQSEWNKHFRLTQDINFFGSSLTPIGNSISPFTGVFDGQGHTINNLSIELPESNYVGLFGVVNDINAEIRDLGVINAHIVGQSYVGVLVGELLNGNITRSFTSGHVYGDSNTGGFIGRAVSTVSSSYTTADVTNVGSGNNLGGFAGMVAEAGVVDDVYATGRVEGSSITGGLVGRVVGGTVRKAYVLGDVITQVDGGPIYGHYDGVITVEDTYYRSEMICQNCNNGAGTGRSYAAMTAQDDLEFGGFDFNTTWKWASCGPPRLIWETVATQDCDTCDPFNDDILATPGSGSSNDPHQICSAGQLNTIGTNSAYWGDHFVLINNIDMAHRPFNMIGNAALEQPFSGSFDGQGRTIRNIEIADSGLDIGGLFRFTDGADIRNLTLDSIIISGNGTIGTLIGIGLNTTIEDITITNSIVMAFTDYGGGLAGVLDNSTVNHSIVEANVSLSGQSATFAGGLAGLISDTTLNQCGASGNISGEDFIGGLVGYAELNSQIIESFAHGDVEGRDDASGGFVGGLDTSDVLDSYAIGDVQGNINVGGFVGTMVAATINNSFSTGNITANSSAGDFAGVVDVDSSLINTYYNNDADCTGCDASNDATALSYNDMTSQDDSVYTGFNFALTWRLIGCGLPRLRWENYEHLYCVCDPGDENFANGPGLGKSYDPYQICGAEQLNYINQSTRYLTASYRLVDDITLTEETSPMIGYSDYPFSGHLDGDGHTISDLTLNHPGENDVAFFRNAENAVINNLVLDNIIVNGADYVGAVVARGTNLTIDNVHVNGNVEGQTAVGTLVGWLENGTVTSSWSTGAVEGMSVGGIIGTIDNVAISDSYSTATITGSDAGGLVGQAGQATIIDSFATGDIYNDTNWGSTGGLVGYASDTTIEQSFASGNIYGMSLEPNSKSTGGLLGAAFDAILLNTYALGNVQGTEYVGGLVGESWNTNGNGSITNSYAIGNVESNLELIAPPETAPPDVGPIIGYDAAGTPTTIVSTYYSLDSDCDGCNSLGAGLSLVDMNDPSNFSGWIFSPTTDYIWQMPASGTPVLWFEDIN